MFFYIAATAEALLHLVCLIIICDRLYEIKYSKTVYFTVIPLLYIPFIFVAVTKNDDFFTVYHALVQIFGILLVRLNTRGLRFYKILYIYTVTYCVNITLVSGLYCIIGRSRTLIELLCNIFVCGSLIFICFTHISERISAVIAALSFRIRTLIVLLLAFSSFVICLMFSNSKFDVGIAWNVTLRVSMFMLAVLICLILPSLLFYFVSNMVLNEKNRNYKNQLDAQLAHYSALSEGNFELRRFRHDFQNVTLGVEKLISDENYGDALAMLRKYRDNMRKNVDDVLMYNTGNSILDAILLEKQRTVSKENIIISFEGSLSCNFIEPIDICVIFGNGLDNAIEAVRKIPYPAASADGKIPSDDNCGSTEAGYPERRISVTCRCGGYVFITIENPTAEKVMIENNTVKTSKSDRRNHGFGLYSIRSVASKYNGETTVSSSDGVFTLSVSLMQQ